MIDLLLGKRSRGRDFFILSFEADSSSAARCISHEVARRGEIADGVGARVEEGLVDVDDGAVQEV